MSSNKSIAVWCMPQPGQTGIKFEVHFNYWRMSDRPQRKQRWLHRADHRRCDFAEIGILVDNVSLVDKLMLYLPARFESSAISDCAPYFTEQNVVQGIFNELYNVRVPATGALELKSQGNRIFCRMWRFSRNVAGTAISASELTVRHFDEGTVCTIQSPALTGCRASRGKSRAYFRLRIAMPEDKDGNPFVEDVPVYDRALLSAYDQIEYLDFRLNEARTLPTAVEQRIATDQPTGSAEITLVAFLTAVPVSAELSVANAEFHKMRLLENLIWSTYAPGLPRGMVVYHWKRVATNRKPINDFSAFVKLQMRRSGRSTLLRYLLFAFAFGVFGNLVAGMLQTRVDAWIVAIEGGLCAAFAAICAWGKTFLLQLGAVLRPRH